MMCPLLNLIHDPAVAAILHDLLALGMGAGSAWCFYRMFRDWRGRGRPSA